MKKLEMKEPSDYKKEFWVLSNGERIVKSTDRVVKATDFSEEERRKSFAASKLPYEANKVDFTNYINLAAYPHLEIELEDLSSEHAAGSIAQEWSQLIDEQSGLPLVRFPINLVEYPDYIPPQVRRERAFPFVKEGEEQGLEGDDLIAFVRERAVDAFDHDIPRAIEDWHRHQENERMKEKNKSRRLEDVHVEPVASEAQPQILAAE